MFYCEAVAGLITHFTLLLCFTALLPSSLLPWGSTPNKSLRYRSKEIEKKNDLPKVIWIISSNIELNQKD